MKLFKELLELLYLLQTGKPGRSCGFLKVNEIDCEWIPGSEPHD